MSAESTEKALLIERDEPVAVVTLNRPDRLNALSHALLAELRQALAALDEDHDIRAIVLTGAGRAFSSGADLRGGPSDAEAVIREFYNPLILAMTSMRTPVIGGINGIAAGAAVSLALACDLRVAADTASFQLSFVKVGLVPDAGSTWLLPRVVGTGRAAEMMLSGRRVTADEALAWGLVNEVIPAVEVRERTVALAHSLAALSSSVGAARHLLYRGLGSGLNDQLDAEARAQGVAQHGPDFQEARNAFAEKRTPRFM
ncbi:enoyl-CoA hydratase-related protein [Sphaerisporangium sp. NPDC051017]|uniref:enoyl-CoA hydratase/isomerase family protein n=1 Tax=Sphaerisporangium sp. NPDC051017 TaxID=3154636 RepID=UPI00341220A0